MQINYFADEPDVATSFTFSSEGNELSDFTNWLGSLNLTFTKFRTDTYCKENLGLESAF